MISLSECMIIDDWYFQWELLIKVKKISNIEMAKNVDLVIGHWSWFSDCYRQADGPLPRYIGW